MMMRFFSVFKGLHCYSTGTFTGSTISRKLKRSSCSRPWSQSVPLTVTPRFDCSNETYVYDLVFQRTPAVLFRHCDALERAPKFVAKEYRICSTSKLPLEEFGSLCTMTIINGVIACPTIFVPCYTNNIRLDGNMPI